MKNLIKKQYNKLSKDKDQREILKKGGAFLFLRFVGIFAGYLFTFIIAKYYGASVNGLVALSFTLFLIISVIGRLGLDANLVKYYSIEKNQKGNPGLFYNVLSKALIFSLLLSGILYYFKEFISTQIFNKPQLEPFLLWTALAITPWVIIIICSGYLRALRLNNFFAFFNNPGRFVFSLAFLFLFTSLGKNELDPIKSHFFGLATLSIFALSYTAFRTPKITLLSNEKPILFFKDSFPMMISTTIIILLGWTDTLFLGVYETEEVLGVYNVALKISAVVALILEAVSSILAPKIASLYQNINSEKEKFESIVRYSTKLIFISSFSISLVLIIFHKTFLSFFGEEFLIGTPFFLILIIGPLICAFCGSIGVILQMIGKQKVHQNFVLIAFVFNLTLNYILTPKFGGVGAAISTVISVFVWNILGAWYLKSKLNITSYFTFK